MTWLIWAAAIAAGVLAIVYLGAPLVVMQNFRQLRGSLVPIREEEVATEVRAFLEQRLAELRDLGFAEVGWLAQCDRAPDQASHCVLLARPADRVKAMASVVVSALEGSRRISSESFEFNSTLEDGSELCTANTRLNLFPSAAKPHETRVQLPHIGSAADLRDVHLKVAGWLQRSRDLALKPLVPGDPDGVPTPECVAEGIARDYDHLASAGYMRIDADGVVRLTTRGAFIMTWRQLWPMSAIVRRRRARRTAALLERVERET